MNTTTIIAIGYACVFLALVFVIWRHIPRIPDHAELQRAEAARVRAGLVPPAPDNRPGLNAADQDKCELIWSLPAYRDVDLDAGCEQLWAAIRDEQQKGD